MQMHECRVEQMLIRALVRRHEQAVCEGDRADVLHGSDPELGHVDHVILGERKVLAEELTVVVDSFPDDPEHFC